MITSLPDGWREIELGSVLLQIVGGGTPSKERADFFKVPRLELGSENLSGVSQSR